MAEEIIDQNARTHQVQRVASLVSRITVGVNYVIFVGTTPGMQYPYVQIKWWGADKASGDVDWQKGRKFYLSPNMTDSEIVQTVLLAAKLFTEHELLEGFKVDDVPLFHPHIDYQAHKEAAFVEDRREETNVAVR